MEQPVWIQTGLGVAIWAVALMVTCVSTAILKDLFFDNDDKD